MENINITEVLANFRSKVLVKDSNLLLNNKLFDIAEICKILAIPDGSYNVGFELILQIEQEIDGSRYETYIKTRKPIEVYWENNQFKNYPGELGSWGSGGGAIIKCLEPNEFIIADLHIADNEYDLVILFEKI